jgi:hypothetical protein
LDIDESGLPAGRKNRGKEFLPPPDGRVEKFIHYEKVEKGVAGKPYEHTTT